ncbi:hypothetical protein NQZ68_013306 [Dissostichus eleginoides]|nr:hypothetical protein NQZ68_013306 [Dissostichus eleginoides]
MAPIWHVGGKRSLCVKQPSQAVGPCEAIRERSLLSSKAKLVLTSPPVVAEDCVMRFQAPALLSGPNASRHHFSSRTPPACSGLLRDVRISKTPVYGQRRFDAGFDGVCQSNQPSFQSLIGSASQRGSPDISSTAS